MTSLLIKLFIKSPHSTHSPAVRRAYGTLASTVGIILNLLLAAGKFTVGFLFFFCGAFVTYGADTPSMLADALGHGQFIAAVLYLGAVASVGAYMLANYSLARLPVARQTIFTNMSTIVSVLSGVIIMGDEFTLLNLASFALILVGVWGVNRFAEKAEA